MFRGAGGAENESGVVYRDFNPESVTKFKSEKVSSPTGIWEKVLTAHIKSIIECLQACWSSKFHPSEIALVAVPFKIT